MRYYFDLLNGHDDMTDLGGAEYRSDQAARQEAILRALDNRDTLQVQHYNGFSFIRVRDETDRTICQVRIDH